MSNILDAIWAKLDQVLDTQQAIQQMLAGAQPEEASNRPLNFKEACAYVDLSESYMRLLCHRKEVPHFKYTYKSIIKFSPINILNKLIRSKTIVYLSDLIINYFHFSLPTTMTIFVWTTTKYASAKFR